MKLYIFLIFCALLAINFNSNHSEDIATQESENFDWLTGNWIRTNDAAGVTTFENWKKISTKEYKGEGFTLKGKDTIFKEDMRLSNETEKWKFIVTGVNEEPTTFQILILEHNRFVAENPQNDFPKRITYFTEGDKLTAFISADKKNISFNFERSSQK